MIKYFKQIIATTDSKIGILKKLADKEGYRQFIIPENIGGRYSVFTPVGLIPIAVAGLSIENITGWGESGNRRFFKTKSF